MQQHGSLDTAGDLGLISARKRKLASALAVMLCALAPAAQAQNGADQIIVVGSRLADDGFGSANTIVRDSMAIERSVPSDTEQLLHGIPGVSLFRPGGAGGVSEVFVRGGEANFTAVYVDGVRLNDATNTRGGSFDFSLLPAFRVERLELAPGAMSAIYGADAMSGVIRIESRWPEVGELLARAEMGSEADWRVDAGTGIPLGASAELGLIVSASDAGDEIEGSRLDTSSVGARLTIGEDDAAWTVIAHFGERDRTSFPEVSGGPMLAVLRDLESSELEQSRFSINRGWQLADNWNSELTVSQARTEDDYQSPAIAPGVFDGQPAYTNVTDFKRTEVLFVNRLRLDSDVHAAFGVNLVDEDGSDDGVIDFGGPLPAAYTLDRNIRSLFAEIGRHFSGGVDAAIAIRADSSDKHDEVSGKIDIAKRFDGIDGRLWATAANGFKLPSFFALGNPLYGNPDLAPEQVESIELGFEQQASDSLNYGLSVFRHEYQDLVDFDFELFTSINRARVDIDGIQANASLAVNETLSITVDATRLSIEPGDGSSNLPRRPKQITGLTVDQQLDRGWSLVASVRHIGKRTISSIPTGTIEDGSYQLANLTLRKTPESGLSWWVAVDNAFDADYAHAPGFPAPGARLRLGAELAY